MYMDYVERERERERERGRGREGQRERERERERDVNEYEPNGGGVSTNAYLNYIALWRVYRLNYPVVLV